jgi:N-acetylmuramoyl-L-alanine amidase
MTALLILDPAHGKDVPGKRSPDGKHEEWKWSRQRISSIFYDLETAAKGFDVAVPYLRFDNEPGLRQRVDYYNYLADQYDTTIMISLHNDAFGQGWTTPQGFTIFTSRGDTMADQYATTIGLEMKRMLPDERWRFDYGLGPDEIARDLDREANFAVLAGYKIENRWEPTRYDGILIENLFMSNPQDVDKLQSDKWNQRLEEVYFLAIMKLMADLGKAPQVFPEATIKP